MQTGEISFCGKIGQNIKSLDTKSNILQEIESKYNEKIIKRHFTYMNKKEFDDIKTSKNNHLACLKTNGNPYLLYLTKINFVPVTLFVDRKISSGYTQPRVIVVRMCFNDDLYDGTLFQGEMIKNGDNWVYIIGDIIAYKSNYLCNDPLPKRLGKLSKVISTEWKRHPLDPCKIRIKPYVKLDRIPHLVNSMSSLDHTCRGILFRHMKMKQIDILYTFEDSRPKSQSQSQSQSHRKGKETDKYQHKMTERIMILEKAGEVDLFHVIDPITNEKHSLAAVNKIDTSIMLQKIFDKVPVNERIEFVCRYITKFKKWEPIAVR